MTGPSVTIYPGSKAFEGAGSDLLAQFDLG